MGEPACGECTLVCPPPEFRGRHALFVETFARPGVDELAHLFRLVRELRVALGDLDDLRAARLGDSRMCAI